MHGSGGRVRVPRRRLPSRSDSSAGGPHGVALEGCDERPRAPRSGGERDACSRDRDVVQLAGEFEPVRSHNRQPIVPPRRAAARHGVDPRRRVLDGRLRSGDPRRRGLRRSPGRRAAGPSRVRGRLLDGFDRGHERRVRRVRSRDGLRHGGRANAHARRSSPTHLARTWSRARWCSLRRATPCRSIRTCGGGPT